MKARHLIPAAFLCLASGASAAALSAYQNVATYLIGEFVPEAGAITYNRDTGTLFTIGDEGQSLAQFTKTGQYIDSMTFDNSGPRGNRALDDPEGVTYMGNGKFVIADERLMTAWVTTYVGGSQVGKNVMPGYNFDPGNSNNAGNSGLEGVAWDPINQTIWGVKETSPMGIFEMSNVGGGGQSMLTTPFHSRFLTNAGLTDIADIYIMAACAAFGVDDPRRMNILILSQEDNVILEMTRQGQVVDRLDISSIGRHTIEGITMDDEGNIYLASEGNPTAPIGSPQKGSGIHVLSAIPEPSTALLGAIGTLALLRRRRTS
jgi:uncharacterized protein YjiK